jgi:transcriptional regulator with XRE-family HTH domain
MAREISDTHLPVIAASLNTAFGIRLQQCRHLKGVTQGVVADRSGMSRVSVANLESGRQNVNLQQIYLLAYALDVQMTELIPTLSDVERCSLAALRPLPTNCVSHADAQFLENSRALLAAILRGSNADTNTPTAD